MIELTNISSRTKRIFSVVLISLPIIAIIWRWVDRSIYYPGWDILGAANGMFLLSTESLWEVVKTTFWLSRHYQYWNQTNSIIYSLVPGYLNSIYPWELWAHIVTLITFLVILYCISRLVSLKAKDYWILAGLLATSPTLLSFAVAGYPNVSGFLPHVLILLIIFSARLQTRPLATLILGLAVIELTLHVYQLGKVIFIVLFLATFFIKNVPRLTRFSWLFLGLVSIYVAKLYSGTSGNAMLSVSGTPKDFVLAMVATFDAVFVQWKLDLPVLPLLGIFLLPFLPRNKWFWTFCLLAQWALLFVLAKHGIHALRPRRFLIVDFYSFTISLIAIKHIFETNSKSLSTYIKKILPVVFIATGMTWQFIHQWEFSHNDISGRAVSLPYTDSSADYHILPSHIDAATAISELANEGYIMFLLYNYTTYAENSTDPVGLPERLYLKLGHEPFIKHIIIFSNYSHRYSHVPILPLSGQPARMTEIKNLINHGVRKPSDFLILEYTGFADTAHKREMVPTKNILDKTFDSLLSDTISIPFFNTYNVTGIKYTGNRSPNTQ